MRSYFLCPVFLPFLKFVIGHIARYAPSSKFPNQQKYRSKLVNLFFHHYLIINDGRMAVSSMCPPSGKDMFFFSIRLHVAPIKWRITARWLKICFMVGADRAFSQLQMAKPSSPQS